MFDWGFNDGMNYTVTVLIVLAITIVFEQIVRYVLHRYVETGSKHLKVDPTQYAFLKHFLSALIYLVGVGIAVYTVPSLRALSVSLFAGAGVLAVIVGFASQQAFSNIVSGLFIVIFRPFRVGDKVKIGTLHEGHVEDITLRHTVIRDFQNKRVVIPNSVISNEVIENAHLQDEKICKWVDFSISYDADIDKAMKIMREEAMKHPDFFDTRSKEDKKAKIPAVATRVVGFGDSSVHLRAWVWAATPLHAWRMGCDLNKSIKQRFDKEGVEIPFPYRTVVYKKDLRKKKPKRRRK